MMGMTSPEHKANSASAVTPWVPLLMLFLLGVFFGGEISFLALFLGGLWFTVTRPWIGRMAKQFIVAGAAVLTFPAVFWAGFLVVGFTDWAPMGVIVALVMIGATAAFFWKLMLRIGGSGGI